MASPISPLVGGLSDAFAIANMIHRSQRDREEFEIAKRRELQQEEQGQANLQMRLNALGARGMTPSDELEQQTGVNVSMPERRMLGASGLVPFPAFKQSDIAGRIVKAGGQRYVLPSQQEQEAAQERTGRRELSQKIQETKTLGDVKNASAAAGLRAKMEEFGIPVPDENADLLGLPHGTKIAPEHQGAYFNAVRQAHAAKAQETGIAHTFSFQDEHGAMIGTVDRSGKITETRLKTVGGKRKAPNTAEERLAMANQVAAKTNEIHAAAGYDPVKAEEMLREVSLRDPFVRQHHLEILRGLRAAREKPKPVSQMTPEELIPFFGGPSGTGEPGAAPSAAPKPVASAKPVTAPAAASSSATALRYYNLARKKKAAR